MDATTNRETPCGAGNACADRGRGDAPRPMVGVVVGRQVQQQLTAMYSSVQQGPWEKIKQINRDDDARPSSASNLFVLSITHQACHGQLYRTDDETKLSTTDCVSQYHEKKFAAC
jgi:hypothetical protein